MAFWYGNITIHRTTESYVIIALHFTNVRYNTSRCEQAPGREFHPRAESEKNYCGFFMTFLVQ